MGECKGTAKGQMVWVSLYLIKIEIKQLKFPCRTKTSLLENLLGIECKLSKIKTLGPNERKDPDRNRGGE